ncbi:hypothetical protein LAT59_03010 [Candidatus Gracilibacteria bacterium]|nr:hypothetical protein [Candidatus Gracilibacteria bacterium]
MTKNTSLILIFLLGLIIGTGGYMLYTEIAKESSEQVISPVEDDDSGEDITDEEDRNGENIEPNISLSEDNKNIMLGESVLLGINDIRLMNMFREESQLCDEFNIESSMEWREFCEDREVFVSQTSFASIDISPDNTKVGFTLESDVLIPDTLVGFFSLSDNEINFLSNYYLGNEFISFSPNGAYFIYRGFCWEAKCGLSVRDSETLEEVGSINNPEYIDMRQEDVQFLRWISDNEIEYELGTEILQELF